MRYNATEITQTELFVTRAEVGVAKTELAFHPPVHMLADHLPVHPPVHLRSLGLMNIWAH